MPVINNLYLFIIYLLIHDIIIVIVYSIVSKIFTSMKNYLTSCSGNLSPALLEIYIHFINYSQTNWEYNPGDQKTNIS